MELAARCSTVSRPGRLTPSTAAFRPRLRIGCRPMRFEVRGIDHQLLRLPDFGCQRSENLG